MAANAGERWDAPPLSVAAAARRLGVAPATLRTWDRRYGIGPSEHRAGQHRRYGAADLIRLEEMRRLLMQGVAASDAARLVHEDRSARHGEPPTTATTAPAGTHSRGAVPAATVRRLREAALRLDEDRVMELLDGELRTRGVVAVWDGLIRPVLVSLGDQWQTRVECVAAEHLLSGCVATVFHEAHRAAATAPTRPVLLAGAPGEAHVLPLHALAAGLGETGVATRLVGAATPVAAVAEAARRTVAAAVVIWCQLTDTADAGVFRAIPRVRGGRLLAAAGPGWQRADLPASVVRLHCLEQALDVLTDLTG